MSLSFESGSYGLRQVSSGNKTVLLMKLTDSALRIIESYLDNANGLRSKPSIQFQGNQGVIQIPVHGEGEVQKFSFHVQTQPPVDCLQQIRTSHSEKVECLGTISQKITINANDDSYDMTRHKMTLAKQEEQKTSTKVIKQPGSGSKIGGKGYKKPLHKGRIIDKSSFLSSKAKSSPDARAPTPPMSRLTPNSLNRSSSPHTIPGKDRSISPPVPGMGRNKTKPMMTITSSHRSGSSPNPNGNAAVAARPLWDRVSHLLALRPYKLPEIILRLQRDKPPDKSRLADVLQQVATVRNTQGIGTEYCLQRKQYSNLELDTWPGYTDSERKVVKKKISEMTASVDSRKRPLPSTQSPENSSVFSSTENYSNPASKKQRVSRFNRRSSGSSPPLEPEKGKSNSPPNASISFGTTQIVSKSRRGSTSGSKKGSPETRSPEKNKSLMKNSVKTQDKRSPDSISMEELPSLSGMDVDDFVNSEEEDYLTKYTQISSDEQRNRYKNDFYAEYQEYLNHHHSVAEVSKKFAQLQQKLHEHKKGSEGYKAVSREVIHEYKKTKKDNAYHRERARWQFLHRKLRHIKDLVSDFDRHKLTNNRPQHQSQFSMQTATKVA